MTVVTHKGLRPTLRLRLGLWSLRWRLRLFSLGLGGLGFSLGLGLRLSLGASWKRVKTVLQLLGLGGPDRLRRRLLRWLLKDAILGLVGLEALGVVGFWKTLFKGKLTQQLVQHTLKVSLGVLVPHTETILLIELPDHHPKLGLSS